MAEIEVVQLQASVLKDILAAGPIQTERARSLARQIAEELREAHEVGISHGGLCLSHIVLLNSTKGERAVITGFGGHTGLRSDMYAFGQVLEALLPGHWLASQCMAEDPCERPDSFELVLEELQDFRSRRTWIGTVLIAVIAFSMLFYELARTHTT